MYTVNTGKGTVHIRKATAADACAIEALYTAVAVNDENKNERLWEGEHSFAHRGGMFAALKKDEIVEIINDSSETVLVGEKDNEILGMIMFRNADGDIFKSIRSFPGREWETKLMHNMAQNGSLGYAQDIVCLRGELSGLLCYLLVFAMADTFREKKITHFSLEIYRVDGVITTDEYFPRSLINKASSRIVDAFGGIHIGEDLLKRKTVGSFQVFITPQVFLCPISDVISYVTQLETVCEIIKNKESELFS